MTSRLVNISPPCAFDYRLGMLLVELDGQCMSYDLSDKSIPEIRLCLSLGTFSDAFLTFHYLFAYHTCYPIVYSPLSLTNIDGDGLV